MSAEADILSIEPLGFPWQTVDPFLFCAHHDDAYPAGDEQMAPAASLAGRQLGMDFSGRDGWSMYHGHPIPGFPRHPHRGFETITLARKGYIDHSDSLGATARFGHGDVQWMTAGSGIVHAEMFPLRYRDRGNHTELFQIWLNLPRENKMVPPYFKMLWASTIPRFEEGSARVSVVAGDLLGATPPAPPPDSWAAREQAGVVVATIEIEAGGRWQLPAASLAGLSRTLYCFRGDGCEIAGAKIPPRSMVRVRADRALDIVSPGDESELLLLQGRPLNEPVAHYGPFVMNTPAEIQQAIVDYQRTEFGGWPWGADGPVHPRDRDRFAIHADGEVDEPS